MPPIACLSWLHRFSRFSPVFTAIAGITVVAGIAKMVAGSSGQVPLVVPLGIALFAAAAAGAGRIVGVVEQWLEVLGQAFDAAPEAQLVATPEGRAAQANLAFERLFPGAGEAALDLVEQAAAPAVARRTALAAGAGGGRRACGRRHSAAMHEWRPAAAVRNFGRAGSGAHEILLVDLSRGRGAPAAAGDTRRASDGERFRPSGQWISVRPRAVARAASAVFCECAGRHRRGRSFGPVRQGKPRARRIVRHPPGNADRGRIDRLLDPGRPCGHRGEARRCGGRTRGLHAGRDPPRTARASGPWSCCSAGSTNRRLRRRHPKRRPRRAPLPRRQTAARIPRTTPSRV